MTVIHSMPHVLAWFRRHILIICLCVISTSVQASETRMALVIGNSAYENLNDLKNPIHDANAIGEVLSALGFQVYLTSNLNQKRMSRALTFFQTKASDADIALIYYAGHGARINGQNYLLPIDFDPNAADLKSYAIEFSKLEQEMAHRLRTNIFFVDACQDDLFVDPSGQKTKDGAELKLFNLGLRAPAVGNVVTFASTAGATAYDGRGNHSIFAGALLDNIQTKNIDIELMLRRVRRDVLVNSNSQQMPQTISALVTDVTLAPQNDSTPNVAVVTSNIGALHGLSENGFAQKPTLENIAAGLYLPKSAQNPNDVLKKSRVMLKEILCNAIGSPQPHQCLTLPKAIFDN